MTHAVEDEICNGENIIVTLAFCMLTIYRTTLGIYNIMYIYMFTGQNKKWNFAADTLNGQR